MANEPPNDKTAEELRFIVQRLNDEANEKSKETKELRNLAENIDEAGTHFWANSKFRISPISPAIQNVLTSTGDTISDFAAYLRNREVGELGKKEITSFIKPVGNIIALSTNTSGTLVTHEYIPVEIATRNEEEEKRNFVEQNLSGHLGEMFRQAWQSFNDASSDPERAASFLMREVVSQLFHFEAPNKQVKESGLSLKIPDKPTRKERSDFIVLSAPNAAKSLFENILKNLRESYEALNIAHKHETLADKRRRIKNFLNQATEAIYLYLKNKP